MWANLTGLGAEPTFSGQQLGSLSGGTLILNARVRLEPADLEEIVRGALKKVFEESGVQSEIIDLQCFSPAYPEPPYLVREAVKE